MTKEKTGEKAPKLETLLIDDTKYSTIITKKYSQRKAWQEPDKTKVFSYLPGTISAINVKIGDKIEIGQVTITFVAMKMLNTVKSAVSGKVKAIHVKAGDKIPKNFLMLELE